jgi:hypothetical protein
MSRACSICSRCTVSAARVARALAVAACALPGTGIACRKDGRLDHGCRVIVLADRFEVLVFRFEGGADAGGAAAALRGARGKRIGSSWLRSFYRTPPYLSGNSAFPAVAPGFQIVLLKPGEAHPALHDARRVGRGGPRPSITVLPSCPWTACERDDRSPGSGGRAAGHRRRWFAFFYAPAAARSGRMPFSLTLAPTSSFVPDSPPRWARSDAMYLPLVAGIGRWRRARPGFNTSSYRQDARPLARGAECSVVLACWVPGIVLRSTAKYASPVS